MKLALVLLAFSILFSGCAVSVNGVEVNPEEPKTQEEGMDPGDKAAIIAFVVLGVAVGVALIATR